MTFIKTFWKEEDGQDLVEYTLLLALVALASAGIFTTAGQSISSIWTKANTKLSDANTAVP